MTVRLHESSQHRSGCRATASGPDAGRGRACGALRRAHRAGRQPRRRPDRPAARPAAHRRRRPRSPRRSSTTCARRSVGAGHPGRRRHRRVRSASAPSRAGCVDAAGGLAEAAHVAEVAAAMPDASRSFHRAADVRLRGLVALIRSDPRVQAFAETELRGLLAAPRQTRRRHVRPAARLSRRRWKQDRTGQTAAPVRGRPSTPGWPHCNGCSVSISTTRTRARRCMWRC